MHTLIPALPVQYMSMHCLFPKDTQAARSSGFLWEWDLGDKERKGDPLSYCLLFFNQTHLLPIQKGIKIVTLYKKVVL